MNEIKDDREIICLVCEFFEKRFPDKTISFEMKCGYFWEWYSRFCSDSVIYHMDDKSLRVYMGKVNK